MKEIYQVVISRKACKDLRKIPMHVAVKLRSWIITVGHFGLLEARKRKGYHDEPLQGKRFGQRSIRLNKSYRAIYTIGTDDKIHFIEILEVNKHEY